MNRVLKKITGMSLLFGLSLATTSCAALGVNNKVKKAPCGPTAGMTDPCGNAAPINSKEEIDSLISKDFQEPQKV